MTLETIRVAGPHVSHIGLAPRSVFFGLAGAWAAEVGNGWRLALQPAVVPPVPLPAGLPLLPAGIGGSCPDARRRR